MYKGIAASPGIVIGSVYVLKELTADPERKVIKAGQEELEINCFNDAVSKACGQLKEIRDKAEKELGTEKAQIFAAHLMILEDIVFQDEIKDKVRNELISAECATMQTVMKYLDMFQNMEDEYLKERAADIKDIGDRLLKNLLNLDCRCLENIDREVVVIAKDITPSDTAVMNKELVKAFATDMGGRTSHTAIMARCLEIPAVVGLREISLSARDGDTVIIDGNEGVVYLNPDESVLQEYREKLKEYLRVVDELAELKNKPCETRCGKRSVKICANIGTPKDCDAALRNGAEGVGLYRTEFLYMDRASLPDEEEQFAAYKDVAEAMNPGDVIIRTLDIGGDKKLSCLNMPEELNPFLGWRAIRICLDKADIFKTQLRAILRASQYGKIKIMYPMISSIVEVRRANAVLAEAKAELDEAAVPYDKNIEVGIMIEIPSAAITADILVKEVDFFSIGTNDLIQYTIAVDRMNENISHLYEPMHPAILRLIKNVIDASHREGKWTGICGEMAGEVEVAPILLGMGLDEFSMSSVSISRVKKKICSLTMTEAEEIAAKALSFSTPEEIKIFLTEYSEKSIQNKSL